MGGFAWVTLATNDSYSLGALVLAHSLRRVNTAHQLVVLVTPGVTEAMKTQLSAVFNVVKLVDVLDSRDADNLALLARPELGITFTKLHCWRLTQFDKCVFLDADTLVLQNSDELFEREELSAAPDAGWPDCFNSGVFVYKPSDETYKALIEFALIHGSFDGGDQGLLNLFFSDWPTKDIKKHLPFVYNMCSTATYSYLPAFKQFGQGLKIIHFIGTAKPWLQPFNTETGLATVSGSSQTITQFVQLWWDLFCTSVHPSLSTEMAGLAGALASVTLGAPLSAEQTALEEHLRRQGWEQGNIDYMGKDSFANIWKKICDTLGSSPQPLPVEETPAPVAPVAAPVYVSSVEISPAGPIDTSPPASYAPVSAPKPTVVASDTEAASKAAAPEAVTVVPEPKSPSVTELVSSEPTVTPTSLDSSAQPSTLVPVVSSNTPAATAPPPEPSASALESATKTETASVPVEPEPSVKTEIPPVTGAPLTPVVPEVLTVPLSETSAPSLPASQDQTLSPTSVSETPVIQTATITSAPSLTSPPTSVQVPLPSEPATPPPVAIDTSSVIQPSVLSPSVASSQSEKDPEVPLQASPPVAQIIAIPPTESSTTTSPVEVKAPISQTTPDILTTTSSDAPTAKAAPISEEVAATVTKNTSEISSTKPSEPSVEIPKTTPDDKLAEPLTQLPLATEPTLTPVDTATPQQETVLSSDSIPVQPDTPTVTEPTPPTSPPTAPVESPLATKLKVDTELPETPPVGSSSAQPSLVAVTDEPPVPPKRKGGAKANQDGKNQKGGKQSKGKK